MDLIDERSPSLYLLGLSSFTTNTTWKGSTKQAENIIHSVPASLASHAVRSATVHSRSFASATPCDNIDGRAAIDGCSALHFGTAKPGFETQG
jgi:hypothetical protein